MGTLWGICRRQNKPLGIYGAPYTKTYDNLSLLRFLPCRRSVEPSLLRDSRGITTPLLQLRPRYHILVKVSLPMLASLVTLSLQPRPRYHILVTPRYHTGSRYHCPRYVSRLVTISSLRLVTIQALVTKILVTISLVTICSRYVRYLVTDFLVTGNKALHLLQFVLVTIVTSLTSKSICYA